MYVICFYWVGDRWQPENYRDDSHVNLQASHLHRIGTISNELAERYVNNLYYGVKNHTTRDFQFICFTNEPLKVDENIELRNYPVVTKTGVLPRLFMFSREAGLFGHQVLCLDLDVVIVGSLDKLMDYKGWFCTRSKFKKGEQHKLDGDIMSFKACEDIEMIFWTPFIQNVNAAEHLTQGRERYWVRHVAGDLANRWEKQIPGAVVSYKWHVRNEVVPEKASIVSFHGYPRPHQAKDNWIKKYWK